MKYLKMCLLVAGIATAFGAVIGVGTASATETTLCENEVLVCKQRYLAETAIGAELEATTKLSVSVGITQFTCTESALAAHLKEEKNIPLHSSLTGFTFGGCGTECEMFTFKKGELDIELIDMPVVTANGTLTLTGSEFEVNCFKGLLKCFYIPGDIGTLTGGNPATIDLSGTLTLVKATSNEAWEKGSIKGSFKVTAPKPVWVRE